MGTPDIFIVGGGPTGLMLALELSLQNVSYRIIDSLPGRSNKSRAMVMQPRSLELINRHGTAEKFIQAGNLSYGSRIHVHKKFIFELSLKEAPLTDTCYPFPLIISQADTEKILDELLLERYGKKVEFGVKAESVSQDEDGVTTELLHEDGSLEEVRSQYVVGCDGAHSIVRKSASLTYDGSVYPQDFILADVNLSWDLPPTDQINLFMGTGFCGIFPMNNGLFRLVCTRPDYLKADSEPTLPDFENAIAKLVPGNPKISDPTWMTRFHLHHRISSSYRNGRMFVAGDAAHIHSPAGGQGMNTGIQDAVNLAWKLAAVLRGEQSEGAFLDTYNIERRKVGIALLSGTDKAFEFMSSANPVFRFLRNALAPWILPWAMRDPTFRMGRFKFISQLNIRYRHSPIVGQADGWLGKIKGGDRAPNGKVGDTMLLDLLRKPVDHLVLFSGFGEGIVDEATLEEAASSFTKDGSEGCNLVMVVSEKSARKGHADIDGQVHELYGFKGPGIVLVRPDGYITYIGPLNAMDEMKVWKEQRDAH